MLLDVLKQMVSVLGSSLFFLVVIFFVTYLSDGAISFNENTIILVMAANMGSYLVYDAFNQL